MSSMINSLANILGGQSVPTAFDPSLHTNIYFLTTTDGRFSKFTDAQAEAHLTSVVAESFANAPAGENVVLLGSERLTMPVSDYYRFGPDYGYGKKWATKSLLAKTLKDAAREHPHTTLFNGGYLFKANGDNRVVTSRSDPRGQELESAAFRVCATIWQYPLSDLARYYFVCARELGQLPRLQSHTVYINDEILGLRRCSPDSDSGWLDPLVAGAVSALDNELFTHQVVRI